MSPAIESAPGLFGGDKAEAISQRRLAVKGDRSEAEVERSDPLIDRHARVDSGPSRPNQTARLDAECGLCGYTTDKCTCSYGT